MGIIGMGLGNGLRGEVFWSERGIGVSDVLGSALGGSRFSYIGIQIGGRVHFVLNFNFQREIVITAILYNNRARLFTGLRRRI